MAEPTADTLEAELEAALDRNFKRTIRIVGENARGQFSSVWSFLGGNDGFYFSARNLLNAFKVSLHANNNKGYLAYAKPYFLKKEADGVLDASGRTVHEWRLPLPLEKGAVQAAVVRLPADFINQVAHPYVSQRKALVFGIEPGCALEIGIFLSREGRSTLEEKFSQIGHPLFEVAIENWLNVTIVVRSASFDPACLPTSEHVNNARRTLLEPLEQHTHRDNLNMLLWDSPADGEALKIVDIGGVAVNP